VPAQVLVTDLQDVEREEARPGAAFAARMSASKQCVDHDRSRLSREARPRSPRSHEADLAAVRGRRRQWASEADDGVVSRPSAAVCHSTSTMIPAAVGIHRATARQCIGDAGGSKSPTVDRGMVGPASIGGPVQYPLRGPTPPPRHPVRALAPPSGRSRATS
jgi:hypothetical protein